MAVHTNDVVLLLSSSFHFKFCENLSVEDNSITLFSIRSFLTPPLWRRNLETKVAKKNEIRSKRLG